MGFPILVRWHLYIESGSRSLYQIRPTPCAQCSLPWGLDAILAQLGPFIPYNVNLASPAPSNQPVISLLVYLQKQISQIDGCHIESELWKYTPSPGVNGPPAGQIVSISSTTPASNFILVNCIQYVSVDFGDTQLVCYCSRDCPSTLQAFS